MTDFSEMINARMGGWNTTMGIRCVSATVGEVVLTLDVGPQHQQPYGIVHGGVHAGIIETACSIGAALVAGPRGQSVVGLENSTSFLRAVREGTVRATARPVQAGRRAQVWQCDVHDADGRLVATGRVRLLCLDEGAQLAGETVAVK